MTGHEPTPAVLSEELVAAAAAMAPVTASSRTDDIPVRWDERAVLTAMLAYVRDTVHLKCAGLSETARHNGHIDILRELADGQTGR